MKFAILCVCVCRICFVLWPSRSFICLCVCPACRYTFAVHCLFMRCAHVFHSLVRWLVCLLGFLPICPSFLSLYWILSWWYRHIFVHCLYFALIWHVSSMSLHFTRIKNHRNEHGQMENLLSAFCFVFPLPFFLLKL